MRSRVRRPGGFSVILLLALGMGLGLMQGDVLGDGGGNTVPPPDSLGGGGTAPDTGAVEIVAPDPDPSQIAYFKIVYEAISLLL